MRSLFHTVKCIQCQNYVLILLHDNLVVWQVWIFPFDCKYFSKNLPNPQIILMYNHILLLIQPMDIRSLANHLYVPDSFYFFVALSFCIRYIFLLFFSASRTFFMGINKKTAWKIKCKDLVFFLFCFCGMVSFCDLLENSGKETKKDLYEWDWYECERKIPRKI